jgi:hypothetical protein
MSNIRYRSYLNKYPFVSTDIYMLVHSHYWVIRNTSNAVKNSNTLEWLKIRIFHSFIHSPMVLQPFFWPWPILQFRNLIYTDSRTPWTSDQARCKAATYTQDKTDAHTDIHVLRGIRTHDPSVRAREDSSCPRPRGHCNGQEDFRNIN